MTKSYPDRATAALIRAGAYLHDAPATFLYVLLVGLTTLALQGVSPATARHILHARSTNLVQLHAHPARVLVASAFWISGPQNLEEYAFWAVLYLLVAARLEHRVGSLRTIAIFFAGHIGATLFTLGAASFALAHGWAPARLARVIDVGVSYGFAAIAAAFTYALPRRRRWPYAVVLTALFLIAIALFGGYGDVGHLVALGIGFAMYPLVRGAARPSPA